MNLKVKIAEITAEVERFQNEINLLNQRVQELTTEAIKKIGALEYLKKLEEEESKTVEKIEKKTRANEKA